MEQAGDQGRAQDLTHLGAGHAQTQVLALLFRNKVALHHLGHIGLDGVAVKARQAAAPGQTGAQQERGQAGNWCRKSQGSCHGEMLADMIRSL
jgi:hypothetical protein